MFVLKSTYELLLSKYETLMTTHKASVNKFKALNAEYDKLISKSLKKDDEIKSLQAHIKELQNDNYSVLHHVKTAKIANDTKLPSGNFERLNTQVNDIVEEICRKSHETPQYNSHFYITQDTSSSRDYTPDYGSCSSSD